MSVKDGLLALLGTEPMGVAQLRREFESRTGGTWPLNIGQVYTTVQRLERDGLVAPYVGPDAEVGVRPTAPDAEAGALPTAKAPPKAAASAGAPSTADTVERFALTPAGRRSATTWWSTPVERGKPDRNELVIKLALAATMPDVDVTAVVQRQRVESMKALRDYTRLKIQADENEDLAWLLVLESLIFAVEAEVRWLDHIEAAVARAQAGGWRAGADPADEAPRSDQVAGETPVARDAGASASMPEATR